ncbi:MAG: SET domain-containing protein-lysine N-methyltransferase [Methyloceanibacter sp.]|uniref:SET domain-containing protein n=1 Tax=Methyloceanibacter sp. TaxID=1965321 RepID=UPI001E09725B|nr:SET domain-containing protein-lysine N-methyltransferase [Methyloceanibacter sp.]MCB1442969.1 SET domain-containing protein-lysine N-methyltransferase [Methyloceanibacter sp.]MCC0058732.1 SET domain-containing protein-lysine N-methyltransferase [Hyphomicrobiaceae bacterium]
MLLISTYVAPSGIEGLGVFADDFISAGSLIWRLDAKFDILVPDTELPTLPPHMQMYLKRYSFPHLELPGYRVIDVDNGKYMNHSLTPNTDFRIFDRGYALMDIARGEEITCNYHEFDPGFAGFLTGEPEAALNGSASLLAR